jgi:hypothetical protein
MDARYEDAYRRARDSRLAELRSAPSFRTVRIASAAGAAVLAAMILFAAAGTAGAVAGALGGALVGVLGHLGVVHARARSAGHDARIALWASDHGYTYRRTIDPPQTVAFLRGREDPKAEHCFEGHIAGGDGRVFRYTYTTWETRTSTDSQGRTTTHRERKEHDFTVLEVRRSLDIPRMELSRRATGLLRGLTDSLEDAVSDLRTVSLESEEFNGRYQLEVADDADDLAVRRIFTPAVIVALIDRDLPITDFQYEDGTFVLWRDGHFSLDDLDEVSAFVERATPVIELVCSSH